MGPSGEFPIGIPIQTAFLGWFHVEQSPSCGDGQHGPAAEAGPPKILLEPTWVK